MANPMNDLFLAYLTISDMHTQVQINRDNESAPSAAPTEIYKTMYRSCVGFGFRRYLSWIMTEYCELMQIAPSQLVLRAWGLIHALQVLSDLSGIDISGKMVAHSFCLVSVEGNSRRFNLQLREGESSHVDPPMWLDASADGGEYFYVIHDGVGRVRSCWLDIGVVPADVIHDESFPDVFYELDKSYMNTALLLHPRIVDRTSLDTSLTDPFIPQYNLDLLKAALRMYDFFQEVPDESSDEEDNENPPYAPARAPGSSSQVLVQAVQPSELLREQKYLMAEIQATKYRLEKLHARYVQVQHSLHGTRPTNEAECSRNVRTRPTDEGGCSRNVRNCRSRRSS
ncbi:unnamed protein product [Arabis nemorensis]|uniref:Uncharacterized protein n=1 Tax=Arabis nemorensis TaxID=586526 RepID=A0A565BUL7_9BRAS|nr:unnamed protein product [Arabis nemorensis]